MKQLFDKKKKKTDTGYQFAVTITRCILPGAGVASFGNFEKKK